MADVTFLRDLGVVVAAAATGGWLARRAGMSVVVGYLLAGIIVSPHFLGASLVRDADGIATLAQLGLVFLMFGIGLQLSLRRLRQLGLGIVVATGLGALLVYNLARSCGLLAGFSGLEASFLATAVMASSSAVISKVVEDGGLSHQKVGQAALGITVLEDVVAVVMLSLLASSASGGQGPSVLATVGWLGVFVVGAVIGGLLLVPRLFGRVDASGEEVRTLVVAGLLLLLAAGAVEAGYSLALGAFLLGMVVAETAQRGAVERNFAGARDVFSAVFFVSTGMLLNISVLPEAAPLAFGLAVVALSVRVLALGVALLLVGRQPSEALRTALLVTPVGEFAFLIVQLGMERSVLESRWLPAAIGASVLTSLVAPLLARRGEKLARLFIPADSSATGRLLAAYHGMLGRVLRVDGGSWMWKPLRSRLGWAAVEVVMAVALLASADPLAVIVSPVVEQMIGLGHEASATVSWVLFAVVAAIPLLAAWRNLSTVSLVVAEMAVRGVPRKQVWQPLVDGGLRLVAAVLLFNLLAGVVPWHKAGGWTATLAIAAGVVAAVFFGRRLLRLHHEAELVLRAQLDDAPADGPPAPEWAAPAAAWHLELAEVVLDETSAWRGKRLVETGVRPRTGCSVVQIVRSGVCLVNPGPEERLFPGDRVLLAGEPAHLEPARVLLGASGGGGAPVVAESTLRTILVPEEFPCIGATLAELELAHRTGAQVLGLRRAGERLAPVPPATRLEAGDELLVLADARQEKDVYRRLREPDPGRAS